MQGPAHPHLPTAQTIQGPRCKQHLPAEQHLQLPSPAPAGKGKAELPANLRTHPATSPLSPQAFLLSCLHPRGCQRESLRPGHGAAVAPAGTASPAQQQECLWLWYCMWDTPEEERGVGMGQRKQRGTQTPEPRQGMELHSLCAARDPAASFSSQYCRPDPPRPVMKKLAQLWKRPFNF